MENKELTIKNTLLKELLDYFGDDTKRIKHARKVLSFAEELLQHEPADWRIVIPASILHDVGIKVAEKKYGSAAGHYQEKEGPEVARMILIKTELDNNEIDEICQIIAHHHSPGKVNTHNFKVLYDADWLVNFKDEIAVEDKNKLKELIAKVFLTPTGRVIAERLYLEAPVNL
jgi:HD superfamily phosphodiesterase